MKICRLCDTTTLKGSLAAINGFNHFVALIPLGEGDWGIDLFSNKFDLLC